jgi:hypothetical protein
MENLPMKPTGFNALSPQQQQAHRTKIGVRAEAILSQFWREDKTPDAIRALEIEGWMDVLENCSHSDIRDAWRDYQKRGPRTQSGRLYKPDAGALFRIIEERRPRLSVAPTPMRKTSRQEDAEYIERMARDRINPERAAAAARVLKGTAFEKKMGGSAAE